MSEKSQSPSPPGELYIYPVFESNIDPEEREKLERQAVRRMDFKLLGFINALFLLVFLVSEFNKPFDLRIELIVTCGVIQDQTTQTSGGTYITTMVQRKGWLADIIGARQQLSSLVAWNNNSNGQPHRSKSVPPCSSCASSLHLPPGLSRSNLFTALTSQQN
jgi:hypothetical protein